MTASETPKSIQSKATPKKRTKATRTDDDGDESPTKKPKKNIKNETSGDEPDVEEEED